MYAMRLKGLKVATGGSPGVGNSYTISVRRAGSTVMSVILSDSETTGEAKGDVIFTDGQLLSVQAQAAGGANNTGSVWSTLLIETTVKGS